MSPRCSGVIAWPALFCGSKNLLSLLLMPAGLHGTGNIETEKKNNFILCIETLRLKVCKYGEAHFSSL